jgi:hypothetical protein
MFNEFFRNLLRPQKVKIIARNNSLEKNLFVLNRNVPQGLVILKNKVYQFSVLDVAMFQ